MSKETQATLMVIGAFAMIPISILMNAWAVSVLWHWFVTPRFHVPDLSLASAVGITLIASLLQHRPNWETKKSEHPTADLVSAAILGPLWAVGIGWITTYWL